MKRALLTGGSGQVGKAVIAKAEACGFSVFAPTRDVLDLAQPGTIIEAIDAEDWHLIINCGAYTAVDRAQADKAKAHAINRIAPGVIAQETALRGIPVIQVSTDYVFDGDKPAPYFEDDRVAPINVYGASKEGGEAAIRTANPHHAIIRTAWVLSADGANFLNTMLRLAETRDEIGVVSDQIGCPSSADDIANAILTVADVITTPGSARYGTWHFVNSGEASWHELASFLFARAAGAGLKTPRVNAITTADYPTPARRPANSRLDTSKFTRDFGMMPRPWQEAIGALIAQRLGNGQS